MGRLFWKIFIGLWLTLLVTGAFVGGLVWQHNKERIEQLEVLADSPRAEFSINIMANILREEGRDGLEKLIAERNKRTQRPLRILIINESGKDLLGRPVPGLILNKARDSLKDPQQSAIQQVSTPEGEKFLLLIPHPDLRMLRHANAFPQHLPLLPLFIVFLGSLLFSAGLAWYITRPLHHLSNATKQFAKGKLDTRVMHKYWQP